jgi:CRP-like cAMP-binding protein
MPEWLPAVRMHRKDFEVKKGGKVFSEGEAVTGMFFVYGGALKVHKRWDTGKELIVRFAKSGDIIGYLGLGRENGYPVSATAIETSIVCYISMGFFNSTLRVNPLLTIKLMHLFAHELELSQKSSRDLAHMPVKARIAQSFLALKEQFGTSEDGYLNINISRQDIASYSGTTYETVFKVINELAATKAIRIAGKSIRINDDQMLLNIIGKDNDKPEDHSGYLAS